MLAFRIFVMLACLIIVPMAAIFGSAFPDVVKSVLVDRIVYWATGKLPEAAPMPAPEGFGTVAPAGQPGSQAEPNRGGISASEAPRWGAPSSVQPWQSPPGGPQAGGVIPATATMVDPAAGNQRAEYILTSGAMPGRQTTADPPYPPVGAIGPAGTPSAERAGAAPASTAPPQTDPFTSMERKLREYGATYYLLETWGNDGELFRFHCKMAIANNPNYTRHFEATDRDALRAMKQVLDRVEAWHAGRPQ